MLLRNRRLVTEPPALAPMHSVVSLRPSKEEPQHHALDHVDVMSSTAAPGPSGPLFTQDEKKRILLYALEHRLGIEPLESEEKGEKWRALGEDMGRDWVALRDAYRQWRTQDVGVQPAVAKMESPERGQIDMFAGVENPEPAELQVSEAFVMLVPV